METGTCNASEVAGSELESAGRLCARAVPSLLFPPATWTSQELSFVETLPDLGMSERTHQFFPIKIAFSLGVRASSPHQSCHLWGDLHFDPVDAVDADLASQVPAVRCGVGPEFDPTGLAAEQTASAASHRATAEVGRAPCGGRCSRIGSWHLGVPVTGPTGPSCL